MLCLQCGKEVTEGSKFCVNCGNRVEIDTKEKTQSQKGQDIHYALEDAAKSNYSADNASRYTKTNGNKKKYLGILITFIAMLFIISFFINAYEKKETSPIASILPSFKYNHQELTPVNPNGGWKFLTWGMGVNEVNDLIVKNGMNALDTPLGGGQIEVSPCKKIDCTGRIAYYSDNHLYYCDRTTSNYLCFHFLGGMLEAVEIHYPGAFDRNNSDLLIEQLRKKFPNGNGEGRNYEYADQNILAFTGFDGIWFVNPFVKKLYNEQIEMQTAKDQRENKEMEDSAKKFF